MQYLKGNVISTETAYFVRARMLRILHLQHCDWEAPHACAKEIGMGQIQVEQRSKQSHGTSEVQWAKPVHKMKQSTANKDHETSD
eukprot:1149922-Pelagomonas_calceolata.AAC.3